MYNETLNRSSSNLLVSVGVKTSFKFDPDEVSRDKYR